MLLVPISQSAQVLLNALSAHATLRSTASVLRSSHALADLAVNDAYNAAEGWATQLSSLAVALEFPALDLGLDHDRGTVGAMPLLQVRGWVCGFCHILGQQAPSPEA